MTNEINYSDFKKIDIRLGTIIEAKENNLLNKPQIVLKIDFGTQLGIKKSSGNIIGILNSDDYFNENALKIVSSYFSKYKIDFLLNAQNAHSKFF